MQENADQNNSEYGDFLTQCLFDGLKRQTECSQNLTKNKTYIKLSKKCKSFSESQNFIDIFSVRFFGF